MYWKNTKRLQYFFALTSIIVIASLVNIVGLGNNNQASALTDTEKQQCFDKFGGKDIIFTELSIADQGLLNSCRATRDCVDAGEGTVIGSRKITCTNPVIATASTNASDAEVAPLVKAVCGDAPAAEVLHPIFLKCAGEVRVAYDACDNTGGPVTSNMQDTDANTAKCFVKRVKSISLGDANKAIAQGRTSADKIITDAANQEQKKACDAVPGTIVNGTCVPKPEEKPKTTCAIDGIGWIMCPVMDFMAKVVDGAYGVVGGLLKTPPINTNTTDSTNGTYQAWAAMRTIANVAFVIAFLIIIFSQLTSVGITNYGVKKMLPRIVIAAILVNLSYFICAIAVDLSNIAGSSMAQVFGNLNDRIAISSPDLNNGATQTGKGWAGIVAALLAGGAALYAGLSVLLPALIAALVAIVTVFLVLTLRQALIIILIVISPLAFVAFLLPNTEDLFKKWRKLLTTLLLMFPIIALIFGGSALASKIIMASDTSSFAVQVMGALVAIIPLFITPIVMKTAGGLLNRFGGFVNNPNKGPFDRMRKGAEGYRNNRQEYRKLKSMNGVGSLPGNSWMSKKRAGRAAVLNNRKSELNRANASYIGTKSATDDDFRAKLAQGGGTGADDRAKAASLNVRLKLENEEIEQAIELIKQESTPTTEQDVAKATFIEATKSGDTAKARAAQKILMTQLGAPGIQALHESIGEIGTEGNAETIKELRRDINASGMKGKDNAVATWGYTDQSIQNIESSADTFKGLNPTELAGQNIKNLNKAQGLTGDQARSVLSNQNAAQLLSGEKREFFERLSQSQPSVGGPAPTGAPPAPPTPVPPPSPSNGMLLSPNETVAIDDRAAAINASNKAQQDALSQGYSAADAQKMGDAVYKNHPDIK
ncbi:hypothetical protein H7X68_03060 [Candidatus Saccharibacteria bacterium]|nr:hypothetical protein [Candidatus Saccharibacteria bacterium]